MRLGASLAAGNADVLHKTSLHRSAKCLELRLDFIGGELWWRGRRDAPLRIGGLLRLQGNRDGPIIFDCALPPILRSWLSNFQ